MSRNPFVIEKKFVGFTTNIKDARVRTMAVLRFFLMTFKREIKNKFLACKLLNLLIYLNFYFYFIR